MVHEYFAQPRGCQATVWTVQTRIEFFRPALLACRRSLLTAPPLPAGIERLAGCADVMLFDGGRQAESVAGRAVDARQRLSPLPWRDRDKRAWPHKIEHSIIFAISSRLRSSRYAASCGSRISPAYSPHLRVGSSRAANRFRSWTRYSSASATNCSIPAGPGGRVEFVVKNAHGDSWRVEQPASAATLGDRSCLSHRSKQRSVKGSMVCLKVTTHPFGGFCELPCRGWSLPRHGPALSFAIRSCDLFCKQINESVQVCINIYLFLRQSGSWVSRFLGCQAAAYGRARLIRI